jgi:hypothetical protein
LSTRSVASKRTVNRARRAIGAFSVAAALLAGGCGGGAGGGAPAQAPSAQTGSEVAPGASTVGEPGASQAGGPASASAPAGSAPVSIEMKPPVPSAMVEDLQALGIDAKNLPAIERLAPRTLRGVMKLLAKSLGGKCGDCHQEGDFAAPTRRKKIAARMWDEFAAKLALADGSPLFCDSCHQGRILQLDRHDKKALSHWMDDNFVAKLARKGGKSHECETCHVDMEMHFLAQWGR